MSLSKRGLQAPRALVDDLESSYGHLTGICRMCAGGVGYGPAPMALREASLRAAEIGGGYGPVAGEPALLAALREKLFLHNGLDADSEGCSILVTAGANQAFLNVLLAVADGGDRVILFAPYYFSHYSACVLAGLQPVVLDVAEDGAAAEALQRYAECRGAIDESASGKVRAVVVCTPCNPTGLVLENAALWKIANICERHGWWLIVDEAYEHFDFEMQLTERAGNLFIESAERPSSLAGMAVSKSRPYLMHRRTIHIFSMSKSFGMAGYRVGYIVCSRSIRTHEGRDLFDILRRVNDTVATHASRQSQLLAVCVLHDIGCITILQSRRLRVLLYVRELWQWAISLARAGIVQLSPHWLNDASLEGTSERQLRIGAFYVFFRVILSRERSASCREARDMELCRFLAEHYRVLVAPGSIFGMEPDDCWLRVSVGACCSNDVRALREALHRLSDGITEYRHQRMSLKS